MEGVQTSADRRVSEWLCSAIFMRIGPSRSRTYNFVFRVRWRGGRAVSVLASHQSEAGSIPGRVTPRFSLVGIAPDDTTGQWVFSEVSRFLRPFIQALLHTSVTLIGCQDLSVKSHPNIFSDTSFTVFIFLGQRTGGAASVKLINTCQEDWPFEQREASAGHGRRSRMFYNMGERGKVAALRCGQNYINYNKTNDLHDTKLGCPQNANNSFLRTVSNPRHQTAALYSGITTSHTLATLTYSALYGPRWAEWLDYSPPTKRNRIQFPSGSAAHISYVGIVPHDGAGWRVYSGIFSFYRPCIPALLHTHLTSSSSALKTSMLKSAKISPIPLTRKRYRVRSLKESAMTFVRDPSQHLPGVISEDHGRAGNRARVLPNASPVSYHCATSLGQRTTEVLVVLTCVVGERGWRRSGGGRRGRVVCRPRLRVLRRPRQRVQSREVLRGRAAGVTLGALVGCVVVVVMMMVMVWVVHQAQQPAHQVGPQLVRQLGAVAGGGARPGGGRKVELAREDGREDVELLVMVGGERTVAAPTPRARLELHRAGGGRSTPALDGA
ncbi:hypothetical protein PR048_007482 [Dryococelus australis]|uniref:Uncharacterized protein n=1 Tax=Dryococelus australis TaxID=614101 RepID=A0ABQ9HUC9_9NEOP|nr:hypothetical protein PR048_007482 [Dryococelus australis]